MTAGTLCRCGHLLDCCADCRGWLVEHSPRIADAWAAWLRWFPIGVRLPSHADAAEADDLAYFRAVRR